MIKTFKPHLDVLSAAQKRLWKELAPAQKLGFVLYGGTAIALRLGHRHSVDFDFFTDKPLDQVALKRALPFIYHATILQDRPNVLTMLVPSDDAEVKISFFGTIGIGRVDHPEVTEDRVLQVASLDDLMATKVKVILQRAEAKDYQDIAAMIRAGVSVAKGLSSAREMFGPNFQPSESLKAMVYFGGGDLPTLSSEDRNVLARTVAAVHHTPPVQILSRELSISVPHHTTGVEALRGKDYDIER
ncbi:MAG: nucleotidyl transferase AbiEii/AbiGii toxin family protein [Thiobacillaceae bacterium]